MKQLISKLWLISLLSIFLIACSDQVQEDPGKETTDSDQTATVEETSFPLEITDQTGHSIRLEKEPETIISVMPSNTEILFALDLGDKVIAVTENDTYPEEVLDLDTVGDFTLNVEKIISLNPDLVLAHESSLGSSFDAFEQIEEAGINVYFVADAQTIEETYDTIYEIGKVTGANEAAGEVVKEMQEAFEEIDQIVSEIDEADRKSVLFEISPEPEIYTGGKGTFFHELIEKVGGINAASEIDGWAQIDPEAIVDMNPDVILTVYGHYVDNVVEQVLSRDGFSEVSAIKEKQVYDIDEDTVSRPGPRLVEGARAIGEVVYPDYFTK